jgi:hypothetical protein
MRDAGASSVFSRTRAANCPIVKGRTSKRMPFCWAPRRTARRRGTGPTKPGFRDRIDFARTSPLIRLISAVPERVSGSVIVLENSMIPDASRQGVLAHGVSRREQNVTLS